MGAGNSTEKSIVGRPFPKGLSGNPNGRPRLTEEEREALAAARRATPLAIATLVNAMREGDVDAAVALLRHVYPKGAPVDLDTVDAPTTGIRIDLKRATTEQLAALAPLIVRIIGNPNHPGAATVDIAPVPPPPPSPPRDDGLDS